MRSVWALAGMCLISTVSAAADTGGPVPAVWKEQHVDFFYTGRTSRYSCDGLRDKMRAMLLDMGARRDLRIMVSGCDETGLRMKLHSAGPSLSIVFSSPALPDPAAKPLRPGDLAAVDARFVEFTIANDAFRNMGIGDCELVEEFAHQILPKLAARNVQQHVACVPDQESGSRYWVRGEILRALPPGEQGPGGQGATAP